MLATNCKAIYNDALRWWDKKKKKSEDSENTYSSGEFSIETDVETKSSVESKKLSKHINFDINVSRSNWKFIQPIPAEYHRKLDSVRKNSIRKYMILPPGIWTNFIANEIAKHPKNIICSFVFKRAKVYSNGTNYVEMDATCATCHASLKGIIENKPEKNVRSVKISFILKNFNKSHHNSQQKVVKNYGEMIMTNQHQH